MKPADVTTQLPPHPQEAELRKAEMELAQTLTKVAQLAARQLRDHDRMGAAVTLTQIVQVSAAAQKAMVKAIQDQMDVAHATQESS